jgi:HSP20 family protein
MNLVRYNPITLDLLDNSSRWFDDYLVEPSLGRSALPAVDVRETDSEYLMEVELPGLTEKDVEVKLDNNLLTISSNSKEKKEEKKNGYVMRERRSASFSRSFVLPEGVDREKIDAEFRNGVLNLTFPKVPAAKPKNIEVKSGDK